MTHRTCIALGLPFLLLGPAAGAPAPADPAGATPPPAIAPDRTWEYVTFGGAAVATVAAFAVWLDAGNEAAELVDRPPTVRRIERVGELWGQQQVALGAALAGLALTGLTGWLAFRPDPQSGPVPTAGVLPGGGMLGLQGHF